MICTFILNERPLSTFECSREFSFFAGRGRLCNYAYYDDTSARVWARLVFDGVTEWVTYNADPEGAEPYFYNSVPGSLLSIHDKLLPDYFPDDLIEREFFLHVAILRKAMQWHQLHHPFSPFPF